MTITNVYALETENGHAETLQRFAEIEQQLHTLADSHQSKIQLVKQISMGDMHNGPEEYAPETTLASRIDLQALFTAFFNMGHYQFIVETNADNSQVTIQTNSTYGFSSCWFDQRIDLTVQ